MLGGILVTNVASVVEALLQDASERMRVQEIRIVAPHAPKHPWHRH